MGTLEEIAEILTWSQLGLINSPVGFLNLEGYYDHLLALFENMNKNGLLKDEHLELFVSVNSVKDLLVELLDFNVTKTNFRQKLGLT